MFVTLVCVSQAHSFRISTTWTGNDGKGTADYRSYRRDHEMTGPGKSAPIAGSSDPAFRGDGSRYNPEELLVASLSACHLLWMLHLCADAGIVITDYQDDAAGTMVLASDGGGQFSRVVLRPRMTITDSARIGEAEALHARAHQLCFIARSVNFPVEHQATVVAKERGAGA
ncbi:MAG: OsmC family protein [Acidobacteriota bacterium]|nr:OsmC family protein [Acidobacteriota bacterium]